MHFWKRGEHFGLSYGDYGIQTGHNKTLISKVTLTPLSITHKSCDLEFLALPTATYSHSVDNCLLGRLKVPKV